MQPLEMLPDQKYINYAVSFIFDAWDGETFDRLRHNELARGYDQLNIVYESADEHYIYQQIVILAKKFEDCAKGIPV